MLLISSRSSGSGLALCAASAVVLGAAFLLYQARLQAAQSDPSRADQLQSDLSRAANAARSDADSSTRTGSPEEAEKLLRRTLISDSALSYSADAETVASYGARTMRTRAHLMRAPRRLTITYLSGDQRGLQAGYNERWFWRRDGKAAPMQAYAEVAYRPDEMAAQRFAVLMRNYGSHVLRRETVGARACDVVEVRRKQPLEGSAGPYKRLWLDRATGLTLRADSYNYSGAMVSRSVLSNVKVTSQMAENSFVTPSQMKAVAQKTSWKNEELGADRTKVARTTGIAPPAPGWLPAGFVFDSVGMHNTSLEKGSPLAALSRYGDGLNIVSIFAFKTPPGGAAPSTQHLSCAFGASAMAMRETPDGFTLLAIGDLPTAMLDRILSSVPLS